MFPKTMGCIGVVSLTHSHDVVEVVTVLRLKVSSQLCLHALDLRHF